MRRVVVTGIGAVTPLGVNVQENWENAQQGKSGIGRITRFDPTGFRTQIAGEVKDFDPSVAIPHKELKKMCLFIQYALVGAAEALADSNLTIDGEMAHRCGVLVGAGIGGIDAIEKNVHILRERGESRITPFFIPMTITNLASGQISIFFGTKGYNACVVSACSSANHSIGDASWIIRRGDADVMITGGTESTINPLSIAGFSACKALSRRNETPEKASRPFDKGRDGFVLSEGCGILILEELEHAKRRGAKIYAELTGYGFSSDASHITMPSIEGPIRAMQNALHQAQCNTEDIDYINAHGTSTPIGDINEINAIKTLFKDSAYKLSVSSSKSMTGHLLGGAGGIEAVITLLSMRDGIISPTINVEDIDPDCDIDITPNIAKERNIKIAMSNSFGFGGTNATLIFQSLK